MHVEPNEHEALWQVWQLIVNQGQVPASLVAPSQIKVKCLKWLQSERAINSATHSQRLSWRLDSAAAWLKYWQSAQCCLLGSGTNVTDCERRSQVNNGDLWRDLLGDEAGLPCYSFNQLHIRRYWRIRTLLGTIKRPPMSLNQYL